MGLLQYYPKIEELTKKYPVVKNAYHELISLYNGTPRSSGRPFITHFLGTADRPATYSTKPHIIIAALLHDIAEDYAVSFDDVKAISGSGLTGTACSTIVSLLTKPASIKDKKIRDQIYMRQLWTGVIENRNREIGIIKICDRLDNLTDLQYLQPERIAFITKQSISYYFSMALRLNLPSLAAKLVRSTMRHLPQHRCWERQIMSQGT